MPNIRMPVRLALAVICALLVAMPAYATFPGRNGRIAFQVQLTDDSHVQIYTVRPNGNDLRQITHFTDADGVAPDWSPDGRQIAFQINREGAPFCSIALMNSDGRNIVELTPVAEICENDPHFTPDGARIIFDRFDPATNDEAFWIMDVTGNNRERVGQCCADPNVAPNGERFSYVAFNGEDFGEALFTANLDGTDPFQVTQPFDLGVAIKQDWAPDGRRLAFTKNGYAHPPGVSANVATIRPDGTGLRMLTHFEGGEVQALVGSYSPDGRWIVFRLEDHGRYGLYKMRPDGSHVRAILPLSSFKPRVIAWGPKRGEENDDEDTVEILDDPSAGSPSVPVAEQGNPKGANSIPNLDLLDGDRVRSSTKSSCVLLGRPCSPNGSPPCCGTLQCVFSGGSTRVGYACK
jgi:Tol biopolymer transport system component